MLRRTSRMASPGLHCSRRSLYSQEAHDRVIQDRHKYMSAALQTFTAFDEPLVLERGEKQYVFDDQGNKYIDLVGQNLCVSVGHCHPKVVKAATDQMQKMAHCSTMYYHEQPTLLAKELVSRMPPHPSGEDWVVQFVTSGSEAVDLAVQLARAHSNNQQILTLAGAYHGLSGVAAGLTSIGKKAERKHYSQAFPGIIRVRPNVIEEIESIMEYGSSDNIAAFIAEPLQGYGGIKPLKPGYLRDAFKLVRENGGVCILDSVQCGMHRLGHQFLGFETEDNEAVPDIVTLAKGLGNGIGVIGAVISTRSIGESFATRMSFNTMGSQPVSTAVGRAVLQVMDEEKLAENCVVQGERFTRQLGALCERYPQVLSEVRGTGLFQGLQVTGKDKPSSTVHALEIHRRMLPRGVMLGRGSALGNLFRVQPPLCIESHDVDTVCDALDEVVKDYVSEHQL